MFLVTSVQSVWLYVGSNGWGFIFLGFGNGTEEDYDEEENRYQTDLDSEGIGRCSL